MANAMPPALADLAIRLGMAETDLDALDSARAEAALEDASALVLAHAGPAKADDWTVDAPRVVWLIALKAARREYDNPHGIQQETLGGHTVGVATASGVYLTKGEKVTIDRAAGRSGKFVGTVRTPSAYGDGEAV